MKYKEAENNHLALVVEIYSQWHQSLKVKNNQYKIKKKFIKKNNMKKKINN
jgi:hypothetical protein